ncbi:MAG: D-aminoacyl-tRNA deacylase [Candidatus Bathyarchaeia archaeon]
MPSMILAYRDDPAAANGARWLQRLYDFERCETPFLGVEGFRSGQILLEYIEVEPIYFEDHRSKLFDSIIFLSKHSGRSCEPRLTVHVPGNTGGEALMGGEPYKLGLADPRRVKSALRTLAEESEKLGLKGWRVSMEGTHHGPTSLDSPVTFVEIGSSEDEWIDPRAGIALARAAWAAAKGDGEGRIGVGFGGDHYCTRLTEAVLSCGIALGHVIPRYQLPNIRSEVVASAFERTGVGCSLGVMDWKGLKGRDKRLLMQLLEDLKVEILKV